MSEEPVGNLGTKLLEDLVRREFEKRMGAGSGDGGDNIGPRLSTLEQKVEQIQAQVARLDTKFDQFTKEIFELKGRVSQLPSLWQLFFPLLAFVVAIFGLQFAFVRFALPHP
jgi:hypothetical protein